jgi:hypothetical protein
LLVVLHGVGVANRDCVRILAGIAAGATPTQQVPALIELYLETLELCLLVGTERLTATMTMTERVLALDQLVDVANHVDVVHDSSSGWVRRLLARRET